jgi:hypothetical protein
MKTRIYTLLFSLLSLSSFGQDNEGLFGPGGSKKEAKSGFILDGNVSFDIPAADMAKRFGLSYRIGPGVLYKTKTNWLIGAKFDFILGGTIKEDSLMNNITDKYSAKSGALYEFLDNTGKRIGIPVYERGYATGLSIGKIISFSKQHPDNGLTLLTTVGFIQHRLDIYDKDKVVNQLSGNYIKGYDRLTNGSFVEQYVGYSFFSNSRLVNFTLGFDGLFGFTRGRRDYLYDVMRPDNKQRLDILYGIRGGWFIPVFKRKSEELMFD